MQCFVRGPDTNYAMQPVQSAVDASPPDPPPAATWDMRIYASNSVLNAIPSMGSLNFIGSARIPVINFRGLGAGDFKKVKIFSCNSSQILSLNNRSSKTQE